MREKSHDIEKNRLNVPLIKYKHNNHYSTFNPMNKNKRNRLVETPLGLFERLPKQLIAFIARLLDLKSLVYLSHTSKEIKKILETSHAQTLFKKAEDSLPATLKDFFHTYNRIGPLLIQREQAAKHLEKEFERVANMYCCPNCLGPGSEESPGIKYGIACGGLTCIPFSTVLGLISDGKVTLSWVYSGAFCSSLFCMLALGTYIAEKVVESRTEKRDKELEQEIKTLQLLDKQISKIPKLREMQIQGIPFFKSEVENTLPHLAISEMNYN